MAEEINDIDMNNMTESTGLRIKEGTSRPPPPPLAENKKFRRIKRRCQTNQSRKNHPLPQNRAYKIPHLQSKFPPNSHLPNGKDPHPAIYKFIDTIDIPPNLA